MTATTQTPPAAVNSMNDHLRRRAIEGAHKAAQDAVERAKSILRDVEGYARRVEDETKLVKKAENLDWMINFTTQRLFDTPQMVTALTQLVGAVALTENE